MNSSANFTQPNGNKNSKANCTTIIQEPENQIIPDPRGPMEYSLDYESLQKFCQKQYYADGNVSPNFIAKIIEQAGGSPYCSKSQNIDSKLKKWVNNKNNNTRTKYSPNMLSIFLKSINYENYQNDNFIKEFVDSCKTGEEKQWYNDSVPLIKRLISILVDFANAFDSGHKMRKLALSSFQFSHSPLYLNITESSQ
ncbi:hypothetical protein ACTFIZ_007582 [Dictyostelium cf. discoideum]